MLMATMSISALRLSIIVVATMTMILMFLGAAAQLEAMPVKKCTGGPLQGNIKKSWHTCRKNNKK